jgi:protein-disulfide isomerase
VNEDIEVGKAVGISGTPASLINGRYIIGAQPSEKFVAVIDEELAAARRMIAAGVPRDKVYAEAVAKNYKKPEPPKAEPPDTTTVWKVAVGSSPVRGKATAQVTMIMFGDFECLFCAKAQATVKALEQEYGDKLRFVFKHNPLPFHKRAEPAAQLAAEARAQGGDARFWEAHDLLFDNHKKLSDADLEEHAKTLKLQWKRTSAALAAHKHAAAIEADMIAADDLNARGTPTFFINGRRLVGNQPIKAFKAIIDEEVRKTDALLAAGTPAKKLYETLQKDGRDPPPPERIIVPAPTAANPGKGAKPGPNVVIVQMFGDFECTYCERVEATMDELIAAFPGKVRVVWRQRPLPMHKQAQLAAEASVEAQAQKGDAGFWAFTKLLWEDQAGLDKEGLIKKATAAGLDAVKMRAALDAGTHQAAVKAEVALAESLKVTATPAFAVGDYYVGGAQALIRFKRAVQRALGPRVPPAPESLHGAKSKDEPTASAAPAAPPVAAAQGPTFGARHLLVMYKGSTRAPAHVTRTRAEALARAQEARKKALAGAKFEDLVSEYSDEPGAAQRGGDLGTFPRGRMVEAFQEGVENTAVGKISVIVETPFGFHVILRTK